MKKLLLLLLTINFFAACSTGSDGSFVIGSKGSAAWHSSAPSQDIREYWDGHEVYELCMKWARAEYESQRIAIAESLKRRGENPMLCYDPQADALRALNKSMQNIEKERNKPKMRYIPMPN